MRPPGILSAFLKSLASAASESDTGLQLRKFSNARFATPKSVLRERFGEPFQFPRGMSSYLLGTGLAALVIVATISLVGAWATALPERQGGADRERCPRLGTLGKRGKRQPLKPTISVYAELPGSSKFSPRAVMYASYKSATMHR
jgi:hypothetical protein